MITAAEALDMSNKEGQRYEMVCNQITFIEDKIVDACMKGKRSCDILGTSISFYSEVLSLLSNKGYSIDYPQQYNCYSYRISW